MTMVKITTESAAQFERDRLLAEQRERRERKMAKVNETKWQALAVMAVALAVAGVIWTIAWATTRDDVERQRTKQHRIAACEKFEGKEERLLCLVALGLDAD